MVSDGWTEELRVVGLAMEDKLVAGSECTIIDSSLAGVHIGCWLLGI